MIKKIFILFSAVGIVVGQRTLAISQVIPDRSLKEPTRVDRSRRSFAVRGGVQKGRNLFHSFRQFSLPRGTTLEFQNTPQTVNILTRVTGPQASSINGLIRANHSANVIFLNPNGFRFLADTQLDIGGDFLATTANSIRFNDGIFLSSSENLRSLLPSSPRILSLNLDSGKSIELVNSNFRLRSSPATPIINFELMDEFNIQSGNTISIIANEIDFNGGIISNPGGSINILGVNKGEVDVIQRNDIYKLDTFETSKVSDFGNISLRNRSLLNSSGSGNTQIRLIGKAIELSSVSSIVLQNQGDTIQRGVEIIATKSLDISGEDELPGINGGISVETISSTTSGNVSISSPIVNVVNGGTINNRTFSDAASGNIVIDTDELNVIGFSSVEPENVSTLITLSGLGSTGKSGDIVIESDTVSVRDGGLLSSFTFGQNASGNISINASDSVNVSGVEPLFLSPALIGSSTFAFGNAGEVDITTKNLSIKDSGRIDSSTFAFGSSGNINLDISDNIEISGQFRDSVNPSAIIASANILDAPVRRRFNLPDAPLGDSGSIVIQSQNIRIQDRGTITVRNDGSGDAGIINLQSDKLSLSNQGGISASTNGGDGGDISIDTDKLNLSDAFITSRATGAGVGGNISIMSNFSTLSQASSIVANAENNRAGNIFWNTNTLLASPDSTVTATSSRGAELNGLIESNIQNTQPIKTTKLTPVQQVDTEVSQICGFDGNRLSTSSKADFKAISDRPDLITAWNIQQRYLQNKGKFFRDVRTGEVKPMRPVLALENLDNGEVRSIHNPNESKYVADLLSSLERKCSKLRSA